MIKHLISVMNMAMAMAADNDDDWDRVFKEVQEALKGLGTMTGKEYGILNKRVTIENKDGTCNDAWVNS
jgi:hypothetical protein